MITEGGCPKNALSIKDALEALEGRWKILILFAMYEGSKRFTEIARSVPSITDKTLSKELKHLEENKLIVREVKHSFPPRVEYYITEHGKSLNNLMDELHLWGMKHRAVIMAK